MKNDFEFCSLLGLSDFARKWAMENPSFVDDVRRNLKGYQKTGHFPLTPACGVSLFVEIMKFPNRFDAVRAALSELTKEK
jgi:hypothetical protein